MSEEFVLERSCPSCGEQCDIAENVCFACGHIFWDVLGNSYDVRAALEHLQVANSPLEYWIGSKLLVNAVDEILEGNWNND